MALLPKAFDSAAVEPEAPREPIPAGTYAMEIIDSEIKPTRTRDGEYLELVCRVLEGEFKGRQVWDRLNLVNNSAQAVEIAHRRLSAICRALGVPTITDSVQLHNRPFLGVVSYSPADGAFRARNEMSGYKPLASGAPPTSRPNAPEPATAPPVTHAEPAPLSGEQPPPWATRRA